jgi:predicted enzyme related to lactoylglutathione lyase
MLVRMIQRMSHLSIYVTDSDEAKAFYVDKLGFDLKMDFDMGNFRWLTVSPKGQPDVQLALLPVQAMAGDKADILAELVRNGKLTMGVMETADCQKTYDELKEKGVEFSQSPAERFYGIEAILKDPFGNRFSLTQPKAKYA